MIGHRYRPPPVFEGELRFEWLIGAKIPAEVCRLVDLHLLGKAEPMTASGWPAGRYVVLHVFSERADFGLMHATIKLRWIGP